MEAPFNPDNVVALGEGAAKGEENLAHIGSILSYSIADSYLSSEALREVAEDAGVEPELLPRKPSTRDAFRRASRIAENDAAKKLALEGGRRLNVMVREVLDSDDALVRQVVREVVDAEDVTLYHAAVAELRLEGPDPLTKAGVETLFPRALVSSRLLTDGPLHEQENRVVQTIVEGTKFELKHHDANAIRRVITAVLRPANAISLSNNGGLYFVPRQHPDELRTVRRFVAEVKKKAVKHPNRAGSGRESRAWATPLVDAEDARETIKAHLDEHIEREAQSLKKEMRGILKSGRKITPERQAELSSRSRRLKEAVAEYTEILKEKISTASADLDLAQRQAVSLLSRVGFKE